MRVNWSKSPKWIRLLMIKAKLEYLKVPLRTVWHEDKSYKDLYFMLSRLGYPSKFRAMLISDIFWVENSRSKDATYTSLSLERNTAGLVRAFRAPKGDHENL